MAQAIGTLSSLTGSIKVVDETGQERIINSGDSIFEGDVISVSGANSQAKITFNNGCSMTLFEGESALIDETAYRLEFFDSTDVAIDLESTEGISHEVAALSSETREQPEENFDEEDVENIDLTNLDDTASGENPQSSYSSDEELVERLDTHEDNRDTNVISGSAPTATDSGVTVRYVDRGGEIEGSDDEIAPIVPTVSTTVETNNGYTNDNTITLSGAAEASSDIIVYDTVTEAGAAGSVVLILGEVAVNSAGNWEFTSDPLVDGAHTISIESVDGSGNSSINEAVATFIVDTVAPDIPDILAPSLTNDTAPLISGYAQEGESITVTIGDQSYTVEAGRQGYWEIQLDSLDDGAYELLVSSADQAGNVSVVSSYGMTIDATAPDAPQISGIDLSDNGIVINGDAESDTTVHVAIGDETQEATVGSNGNWNVTFEGLSGGNSIITVTAVDSAGNVSSTALASVLIDDQSVTYEMQAASGGSELLGLEEATLYGVGNHIDFDPDSETLDLTLVNPQDANEYPQGQGVDSQYDQGHVGEDRVINADESLIISLESNSSSIRLDIDKLNEHENASWSAYNENMQLVGTGSFSGEDLQNAQGQEGSIFITMDDVDGAFRYIVLTGEDADQGNSSSFMLEDLSYTSADDTYNYTLQLDNISFDEGNDTQLYIDGLSEDVRLEDTNGNSIGMYDGDQWVLNQGELESAMDEGELNLQIFSETELDLATQDYDITLVQSDYDFMQEIDSSLASSSSLSFDGLSDIVTVTLTDDTFENHSVTLDNVLQLSNGSNQLEIVSNEQDHQTLTLDANSWEIKTDMNGDMMTTDDGGAFIYTSVDADVGFDLIVDEMITVILES